MSEDEIFFDRNRGLVFHTLKMFKVRRYLRFDWEDLEQECFMALWIAVKTYDSNKSSFSNYAITIIKRRIYSYTFTKLLLIRPFWDNWKSFHWIHKHLYLGGINLEIEDTTILKPNIVYEQLKECLEAVPGRDGDIIRLRYLKCLNSKAIGELYGFSKQRVCQIYKRAELGFCHKYMLKNFNWCFCSTCITRK